MGQTKEVVSRDGRIFEVDTSDEACGRFGGFRHGDKVIDDDDDHGLVVEGVAPNNKGEEVLWITFEGRIWVYYCTKEEIEKGLLRRKT